MTTITASAPGKLVLLGGYAVLEGAPALAVAVDRRARLTLTPDADGVLTVAAPALNIAAATARVDASGRLHWTDADSGARLGLVTAVWNALAAAGATPRGAHLTLDTGEFFAATDDGHVKLGLGSSAALTVALAAALSAAANRALEPTDIAAMARLVTIHRAWQGGRGSGVDIAASLHGGLIYYRCGDPVTPPECRTEAWPPAGAACLFVWSGQSVSTAGHLERLARWRAAEPAACAERMGELVELAERLPATLRGDAAGFVALVAAYADALRRFAAASGLAIFSPAQEDLAVIARQHGAAFKPCGAGGDFGLVVAACAPQLEAVRRAIMANGLRVVGLAVEPRGVQADICA